MSAPSDLRLTIQLRQRDHTHFEIMNDYICFNRDKVRSYQWHHGGWMDPGDENFDPSYLIIEFHDVRDALLFKLTHG